MAPRTTASKQMAGNGRSVSTRSQNITSSVISGSSKSAAHLPAKTVAGVRQPTTTLGPNRKRAASTLDAPGSKKAKQYSITRKAPATIVPDESDESERDQPSLRASRSENQSHDYDDADDSAEEQDEDEDDTFGNGLEQLGTKALKKTLLNERPQWNKMTRRQLDEDTVDQPQPEFTTASELDDHDQEQDVIDDEEPQHGFSKRASDRKAEVPIWAANEAEESDTSPDVAKEEETDILMKADHRALTLAINTGWDPSIHFVPPQHGARMLSINTQPLTIKTFIKGSIRKATGDAIFVNAYPSVETLDDYHMHLLDDVAANMNCEALRQHIKQDSVFVEHISRLLSARVSNTRCGVKKVTQPKIEASFGLSATNEEECRTQVKVLLSKGDYIYPRNPKGMIYRTKPFMHPSIISSIREYYFLGSRGSLASKHQSRFKSSISEGPQAKELEVPMAMVCMVAAVHASLDDWTVGRQTKTEFNSDQYEDVYRGHEIFLNNILEHKPRSYHRLMADLYNLVSSDNRGHSAATIANNSMEILDLEGMEE
ncbi:hypothetical protein H0H92_010892 [Tricholoma furcatifolium]|nr:hypothetical protein H0H92_010892 [Tricholoma furcatifolium]